MSDDEFGEKFVLLCKRNGVDKQLCIISLMVLWKNPRRFSMTDQELMQSVYDIILWSIFMGLAHTKYRATGKKGN